MFRRNNFKKGQKKIKKRRGWIFPVLEKRKNLSPARVKYKYVIFESGLFFKTVTLLIRQNWEKKGKNF